jgi:hypothetical protein
VKFSEGDWGRSRWEMVRLILIGIGVLFLIGCVGGIYQPYSTNDVPLALRGLPTRNVILVKGNDLQPDPATYIILGKIWSHVENITAFERKGMGALNLLKDEAMRMGADAVINIEISQTSMGSSARGLAIRFKKE